MKKRSFKGLAIAITVLFFLTICHGPAIANELSTNNKLTKNQKLAVVTDIIIKHEMVLLDDPTLHLYLEGLINRLTESQNLSRKHQVLVINDSAPYTFAGPVGTIYITTGLLDTVHSEAELAYLLAHEIAHQESNDFYNRFTSIKRKNTAIIAAGVVLSLAIIVLTAGAAAAAMGPMTTATTTSMMITQIGGQASAQALNSSINLAGRVNINRSKVRFGKTNIIGEGQAHPVYAPAIFGALNNSIYKGYSSDHENAAKVLALKIMSSAGYSNKVATALKRKFAKEELEEASTHLELLLNKKEG